LPAEDETEFVPPIPESAFSCQLLNAVPIDGYSSRRNAARSPLYIERVSKGHRLKGRPLCRSIRDKLDLLRIPKPNLHSFR
jgi:hypothetical protein